MLPYSDNGLSAGLSLYTYAQKKFEKTNLENLFPKILILFKAAYGPHEYQLERSPSRGRFVGSLVQGSHGPHEYEYSSEVPREVAM